MRPLPPRSPIPIPRPNPGPSRPQPRFPRPRPGEALPVYHKGGVVKKTGPAVVKKGEKIIPAKKSSKKK